MDDVDAAGGVDEIISCEVNEVNILVLITGFSHYIKFIHLK